MTDAARLRELARELLDMAEQPRRKRRDSVHTGLRGAAFQVAAMALLVEDQDDELAELELDPAEPTHPGFAAAIAATKG